MANAGRRPISFRQPCEYQKAGDSSAIENDDGDAGHLHRFAPPATASSAARAGIQVVVPQNPTVTANDMMVATTVLRSQGC